MNFDDLFVNDTHKQKIMSNLCKISLWISSNDVSKKLTIDFANSCYKLHPDMTICFMGDAVSKIEFVNSENPNGVINNNTLTRHGTYKIAFDRDENIFIVPLAYFD